MGGSVGGGAPVGRAGDRVRAVVCGKASIPDAAVGNHVVDGVVAAGGGDRDRAPVGRVGRQNRSRAGMGQNAAIPNSVRQVEGGVPDAVGDAAGIPRVSARVRVPSGGSERRVCPVGGIGRALIDVSHDAAIPHAAAEGRVADVVIGGGRPAGIHGDGVFPVRSGIGAGRGNRSAARVRLDATIPCAGRARTEEDHVVELITYARRPPSRPDGGLGAWVGGGNPIRGGERCVIVREIAVIPRRGDKDVVARIVVCGWCPAITRRAVTGKLNPKSGVRRPGRKARRMGNGAVIPKAIAKNNRSTCVARC